MKKLAVIFVLLTLIFCFVSCGKTKQYKKIGDTPTMAAATPANEENVSGSEGDTSEDESSQSETSSTRNSVPVQNYVRPSSVAPSNSTTTTTTAPDEPTSQNHNEPSEENTSNEPPVSSEPQPSESNSADIGNA